MGKNCCDRESVLGFTMRGVNTGKAIGMMWQIIWRWRRVGSFFWVSQVVSGIIWRLVVLDFHPRQYMIFTSVYIYIYIYHHIHEKIPVFHEYIPIHFLFIPIHPQL